ncbi:MAG: hypothetical protein WCT10_05115 [Patescibacteria group bacterium]
MTTKNVVTDQQLGILARRQNDLFRRVREGTLPVDRVLTGMQDLIEGKFDTAPASTCHLIDCDARPLTKYGWSIRSEDQLPNVVHDQIEFDPTNVVFHLDDAQKKGVVLGHDLKQKLAGKTVYNARVLDYLLAHPEIIPESWKTYEQDHIRYTVFWGTVYRDPDGDQRVCYLYWINSRWHSGYGCLSNDFGDHLFAAVSAS